MDTDFHFRGPFRIPAAFAGLKNSCFFCGTPHFSSPGPCPTCKVYCGDNLTRPARGRPKGKPQVELDNLQEIEEHVVDLDPLT